MILVSVSSVGVAQPPLESQTIQSSSISGTSVLLEIEVEYSLIFALIVVSFEQDPTSEFIPLAELGT